MLTYIHTHTTINVTQARIPTYLKLKEILKRENANLSDLFFQFCEQYVRLHEPGNPQQRLDTIAKLGKAYRAGKCFECDKKPKFKVFYLGGKSLLLCEEHYDAERFKVKGWVKL